MKTLKIVLRAGTLSDSPILKELTVPLPENTNPFHWDWHYKKGFWIFTFAVRIDIDIA